jgi:hypothetical protein
MDPREWTNKFDLTVMVGLGTGSKQTQLAALNEETQFQLAALQGGLPIVTPENVYHLRMKALEAKNIKGGDLFYTHPDKMPPQKPQQDPAIAKAEMDAQVDQMKIQAKSEGDQMKQEFQAAMTEFKESIEYQKHQEKLAVDLEKQREQQVAQSVESDKAGEKERDMKLVDILWEKQKGEKEQGDNERNSELQAILKMMEDNSKTQNQALLAVLEASLAERETEVAERDAKGKVKKTVSRVKQKA